MALPPVWWTSPWLQTTSRHAALDYQEIGPSVGPIVIQKAGGKPLVRFMAEREKGKLVAPFDEIEIKVDLKKAA